MKIGRNTLRVLALCALSVGGGLPGCAQKEETAAEPPKPPEVTISKVIERPVTDSEVFTGRLASKESVEVRARVRGYLDKVNFVDGQEVSAGMVLFEIDPRTYEAELRNAEGQKAQWIAKQDKAKADVSRYEELVPTGAASAQDLDKARAELGEAIAAISSAEATIERAKLDLEFSKITAPIDGLIGRARVTKGNLVQSGPGDEDVLTTIVSLDPIYVYFDVDERTVLRFRERFRIERSEGQKIPTADQLKIPIELGLTNDDGYPHTGVIDFANNQVDPNTGTVLVRGRFDNANRLFKPGFFARIRVPISKEYTALLVSDIALGTDQGQKFVLVVNDQNIVEKRFVKPGPLQDDGLRVILEGLKAGESIVVNGLQRARPGKPVTPQEAPMPIIGVRATDAKENDSTPETKATGH